MRSAFTLVETIAVMVLLAVLAASAMPALRTISSARSAEAGDEIARRLVMARAHAVATGIPSGVEIDTLTGEVRTLAWIDGVAAPLPVAPGRVVDSLRLTQACPGVSVASVETGADTDAVWFLSSGVPAGGGASPPTGADALSQDAVITLNDGRVVTVHRLTGTVSQ